MSVYRDGYRDEIKLLCIVMYVDLCTSVILLTYEAGLILYKEQWQVLPPSALHVHQSIQVFNVLGKYYETHVLSS